MKLSVLTSRGLCAAALVAAGGFAVSGFPAQAAPTTPTCHGKPATIVGKPGQQKLYGTPGPDVIVTNGADTWSGVFAGDGDDLICVTGRTTYVDAGNGNDIVDGTKLSTAPRKRFVLGVDLGPGADQFIGGGIVPEQVDTGDQDGNSAVDVVHTGSGADSVTTGDTYDPLGANHDHISTGKGADTIDLSGIGATIHGGAGNNSLVVHSATTSHSLRINAKRSRILVGSAEEPDQTVTDYSGVFTSFRSDMNGTDNNFEFVGTKRSEKVVLGRSNRARTMHGRVDLGGGNDSFASGEAIFSGPVSGGPGRDRVLLRPMPQTSLDADITSGMKVDGALQNKLNSIEKLWIEASPAPNVPVRVVGGPGNDTLRVIDLSLTGSLTVSGKSGNDHIAASGPVVHIYGGPGNDYLAADPVWSYHHAYAFSIWGGPGNDRLIGGYDADHLYGQSGRDHADGKHGNDVCSAEVRISCHRP